MMDDMLVMWKFQKIGSFSIRNSWKEWEWQKHRGLEQMDHIVELESDWGQGAKWLKYVSKKIKVNVFTNQVWWCLTELGNEILCAI